MSKPTMHMEERFRLLQITLTREFLVVWASKQPDGTYTLRSEPLDAVALAEVTEVTFRYDREVRRKEAGTRVVGLLLQNGNWNIADEDFLNYAGMCRVGEDIYQTVSSFYDLHQVNYVENESESMS